MASSLLMGSLLLPAGEGARALEAESHARQILSVRGLPEKLTASDQQALIDFLNTPMNGPGAEVQEHNALRNEVAVYLIRTRQQLPELAQSCLDAWDRAGENPVWLDYTLQFAGAGYSVYSEVDQQRMEELLWEKTQNLQENFAGTALLALSANRITLAKKEQWIPTLKRVLQNDKQVPANRMTALQLLTDAQDPEAAETARKWLQPEARTTVPQKLAAISTLAKQGEPQDKALLEPFERHPNRLLRKRAHRALNHL